ncbi:MAG: hypothetical protein ACTJGW_02150, partial [Vibrio casei]|uniref:hypothetical protein n=1 Tax=Vibrio TaxID=662 RepID=UPI003F96AA6C
LKIKMSLNEVSSLAGADQITQVECGIKLTQSHKFAVNSSWVNSYITIVCKNSMGTNYVSFK